MSFTDDILMRLKWDSSQFDKAAENTLALLSKVDETLGSFAKSGISGIDDLSNSFGKLDIDGLNSAIEGVSSHFTLFGRIGEEAIGRIASAITDLGSKITGMVNDLTLAPIASGFEEYGLLMDSTQVILANSGESLEYIDEALEKLNHYADQTIYNFSHMTNAIGRFTAAGVDLDDSVEAIQGLSNLSAMVGVSAEQNSNAMDALAKALSTGSLKLQQWYSFERTGGLAGQLFRDNLIETAKELGYFDRSWTDSMGKMKQGSELLNDAQTNFRETLKYGWVDEDVLISTLKKFTDTETELGQAAFKAATEVRTWKKLWDALTEAAQSSWSETYKYIFGNYEESTKFWTAINDEVSKFIGAVGDSRNEMLKFWHDTGGRDDFLEGLKNVYNYIKEVATPIKDLLQDTFEWLNLTGEEKGTYLDYVSEKFKEWSEGLHLTENSAQKIYNIFQLFLSRITAFREFFSYGGLKNILSTIGNIGEIILNIGDAISKAFSKKLGTNLGGIGRVFADISAIIESTTAGIAKMTNSNAVRSVVSMIAGVITPFEQLLKLFTNMYSLDRLGDIFHNVFWTVIHLLAAVGSAFESVFGKTNPAVEFAENFLDTITNLTAYMHEYFLAPYKGFTAGKGWTKLKETVEGILTIFTLIGEVIQQVWAFVVKNIIGGEDYIANTENGLINVIDIILSITSTAAKWIKHIAEVVKEYNLVYNILDVIKSTFTPFVKFISDVIWDVTSAFESLTGVDLPFNDGMHEFLDGTVAVNESIVSTESAFEKFARTLNENIDDIKAKAYGFSMSIINTLKNVIEFVKKFIDNLNLDEALDNLLHTNQLDLINRGVRGLIDDIKYYLEPVPGILLNIASIIGEIIGVISQVAGEIINTIELGIGVTGKIEIIRTVLDGVASTVQKIKDFLGTEFGRNLLDTLARGVAFILQVKLILVPIVGLIAGIPGVISAIVTFLAKIPIVLGLGYLSKVLTFIKDVVKQNKLISRTLAVIEAFFTPIKNGVEGLITVVRTLFSEWIETKFPDLSEKFGLDSVKSKIETFASTFGSKLDTLKEKASEAGTNIGLALGNFSLDLATGNDPGSKFISYWGGVFGKIKEWISNFANKYFGDQISDLKNIFSQAETWPEKILTALGILWDNTVKIFSAIVSDITSWLNNPTLSNLFSIVRDRLSTLFSSFMSIPDAIMAAVSENGGEGGDAGDAGKAKESFFDIVKNRVTIFVDSVKDFPKQLFDTVWGKLKELGTNILDAIKPYEWIFNMVNDWLKQLEPAKKIIGELIGDIGTFLRGNSDKINIDTIMMNIEELIIMFGEFQFFKLLQNLNNVLKQTRKSIINIFKGVADFIPSLQKDLETLTGSISNNITKLTSGWNEFLNNKIGKIPESISNVMDTFAKKLPKLMNKFTKASTKFIKQAGKSMRDISKGTKRYLTGAGINEAAEGLLKFAAAVAILAVVLWKVSEIPVDQLKTGGIILAGLIIVLLLVAYALSKIHGKSKDTDGATDNLNLVSSAVSSISEAASGLFDNISKAIEKLGQAAIFATFVAAFSTVVNAVMKFAKMSPGNLVKGLVGVGVVMAALVIAFKSLTANGDDLHTDVTFRQVLMMLAMIPVINTLVKGVEKISKMTWSQMLRGLVGMSAVMIAFAASVAIIYGAADGGTMKVRQILAIVVMCVAIHTLASAVKKLGSMTSGLAAGTVALIALMGFFTLMIAVTQGLDSMSLKGLGTLVVLVAAIWLMAETVKTFSRIDQNDLIVATACLDSMMGMFALMEFAASQLKSGKALAGIVLMGIIFAEFAAVLWYLSTHLSASEVVKMKMIADSISESIVSVTAAAVAMSLLGSNKKVSWKAVGKGLLVLDAFFADIVALVGVIGAAINAIDNHTDGGATAGLEKGAEVFEKVGEAIGNFLGAVVGAAVGKTIEYTGKGLETFGSSLTTFYEKAEPFFKGMASVKTDSFAGIESLASAILAITSNNLLSKLDIFGSEDDPFTKFATALGVIAPALNKFGEDVKDVKVKKVKSIIEALKELIIAVNEIPAIDGVAQWLFGEHDLGKFATDLGTFVKPWGNFIKKVSETDIKKKRVEAAQELMTGFIEFVNQIPATKGVLPAIFGSADLSKFAKDLGKFAEPFSTYLETMSTTVFDKGAVEQTTTLAEALVTLSNTIKPDTDFEGLKKIGKLEQFGKDLVGFAPKFVAYLQFISKANYDESAVEKSNTFAQSLVDLSNQIKGSGGIAALFTGDSSLEGIGKGLGSYAKALTDYHTALQGIDWGTLSSSTAFFAELFKMLTDNKSGVDLLTTIPIDPELTNLSTVVTNISGTIRAALKDDVLNTIVQEDSKALGSSIAKGVQEGFEEQKEKDGKLSDILANALSGMLVLAKNTLDVQYGSDVSNACVRFGTSIYKGLIQGCEDEYPNAESTLVTGCTDLINMVKTTLETTSNMMFQTLTNNIKDKVTRAVRILKLSFTSAIESDKTVMATTAFNAFDYIASQGAFAMTQKYQTFVNIGVYLMNGFISGINSRTQEAINAINNLANAAVKAAEKGLKINSPSRVFDWIAAMTVKGFTNRIESSTPDVEKAMVETFAGTADAISGLLNGDIEYRPKINPVVDITSARDSINTMNGLFGDRTVDLAASTMQLASDNAAARYKDKRTTVYNDKNVVSAISNLQSDLQGLQSAMNNMGLYIDGNTLVGAVASKMDAQLGANRTRTMRMRYGKRG